MNGQTSNKWSSITYRIGKQSQYIFCVVCNTLLYVALAVYTRSPAAYSALKSFEILQLPSVSSLKYFTGANIEDPGEAQDCLMLCREQYEKHKVETVAKGKKKPLGEGALIIDEVKVCILVM